MHNLSVVLAGIGMISLFSFEIEGVTRTEANAERFQSSQSESQPSRPVMRASELQDLLDRISGQEPEFAADMLLRLVESNAISSKVQRIEVLERAFRLASSAQEPVRKRAIAADIRQADPRIAMVASGFAMELDAQSLQSRALRSLLNESPAQARNLFSTMQPRTDPCLCGETLCVSPEAYYRTVRHMFDLGYAPEERIARLPTLDLMMEIGRVKSVPQLVAIIELMTSAKLSLGDFDAAMKELSVVMTRLPGDARSFEGFGLAVQGNFLSLINKMEAEETKVDEIVAAYRSFLTVQLNTPPCAAEAFRGDSSRHRIVADFNARIRVRSAVPIEAVTHDPLTRTPAVRSTRRLSSPYQRSAAAQSLVEAAERLRLDGRRMRTDAERASADWSQMAEHVASRTRAWTGVGEKDLQYVAFQKAFVFFTVVELAPLGSEVQREALSDLIQVLDSYDLHNDKRLPWFFQVRLLMDYVRKVPQPHQSALHQQIAKSRSQVWQLYVEVASMSAIPSKPPASHRHFP